MGFKGNHLAPQRGSACLLRNISNVAQVPLMTSAPSLAAQLTYTIVHCYARFAYKAAAAAGHTATHALRTLPLLAYAGKAAQAPPPPSH
jgi:hypothetical protein